MSKRKPRSRKAATPARAARRRVGPLWWGAGVLALGWIAFDANRAAVERHVPQLADLRLPWSAAEAPHARREPTPQQPAAQRAATPRAAAPSPAKAERPPEARQAALRPAAMVPPVKSAVPETRPARPVAAPAPAAAPAVPVPVVGALPGAAGSGLVTRAPTPLRRDPRAGAPVWMVLDAGRPLRVTRREGGFARVESGIFTGWVEAAALPEAAGRPAPRGGTMPTLAAAEARRAGPVPTASVPSAR